MLASFLALGGMMLQRMTDRHGHDLEPWFVCILYGYVLAIFNAHLVVKEVMLALFFFFLAFLFDQLTFLGSHLPGFWGVGWTNKKSMSILRRYGEQESRAVVGHETF